VTYRIGKRFQFSASHVIEGLPEGHKCGRLHGHTYEVEVQVEGVPDRTGFVVDFGDVAAAVGPIIARLDHRHLNDVMAGAPTTSEALAWLIWAEAVAVLPKVSAVRVSETPGTWAEYRP
jgi:6-pyruvoyltetrahydropterin/6-carboxytetrahydropterin synthase